jgi:hypothetical protein
LCGSINGQSAENNSSHSQTHPHHSGAINLSNHLSLKSFGAVGSRPPSITSA